MLDDTDIQTADYIVHQLDLTKFLNSDSFFDFINQQ